MGFQPRPNYVTEVRSSCLINMMFLITGKQFLDFGVWFGQYMMPINGDDQRKGNYVFFFRTGNYGLAWTSHTIPCTFTSLTLSDENEKQNLINQLER